MKKLFSFKTYETCHKWFRGIWLTLLGLVLTTNYAFAGVLDGKPNNVPTTFANLGQTVRTIFDVVIVVASIAFTVLFLVGGIQYLTASGNEESSGKARKLLLDAIIGLIIVLASWAIGGWIINQLAPGLNA